MKKTVRKRISLNVEVIRVLDDDLVQVGGGSTVCTTPRPTLACGNTGFGSNARTCISRRDTLELPVSSSEIRRALAAGQSPAEVPSAVLEYTKEHKLYRP